MSSLSKEQLDKFLTEEVLDSDVEGFIEHLNHFALSLDESDKKVLMAVLCSVLDPFERIKYREAESLLSDEELEFLDTLACERSLD